MKALHAHCTSPPAVAIRGRSAARNARGRVGCCARRWRLAAEREVRSSVFGPPDAAFRQRVKNFRRLGACSPGLLVARSFARMLLLHTMAAVDPRAAEQAAEGCRTPKFGGGSMPFRNCAPKN